MWSPLGSGPVNSTARWRPEPDQRGTWSIVSSCLVTLTLCLWTALHLNIPRRGTASKQAWRKTGWLIIGLLAPEFVRATSFCRSYIICTCVTT
jgi:hypothetical protein